jgi:hypothetical protein
MKHSTNNTPTVKHDGRIFKNDLIFVLALLLSVSLLGLGFLLFRPEGDTVTVTVDGKVRETYALSVDRTLEIITGDHNEQRNLLVIRNGEAYVSEASCPDGICAAHRPISRRGESIACLPHRVVITVRTADKNAVVPDIIT